MGGNALGGEKNKNYNNGNCQNQTEMCYLQVRATKYHKTDPDADKGTKNGDSSTGVKLREAKPGTIGTVSMDQSIVPAGTLVLVTTRDGKILLYLCADKGSAVTSKTASKKLAREEGRGKEWASRPVADIYSPKSVTSDWTTILVIKDPLPKGLKDSERLRRLQQRMSVAYWMPRGLETLGQRTQLLAYN